MPLDDLSLFLFVPANRPDRLNKAAATGADAVIVDLEDAVSVDQKETARTAMLEAINVAAARKPIVIRINGTDTRWYAEDVATMASLPIAAVMLPKTESAAQCQDVIRKSGKPVIALVETARGVHHADEIAQSCGRMAFGNLDFAADLGIGQDRMALSHARSSLVLASRVAQIAAPIDGVTQEFTDLSVVEDDSKHSHSMGFGGKLLIHPRQIEPALLAFLPSPHEIAWAQRILLDVGAETGVLTVDGQMVDAPVVKRAQHILARAKVSM